MADRRIEVVVDKDGGIKIEGKGFSGPECLKATKALEDAIGDKTADIRTKEFYNMAPAQAQNKEKA